MSSNSPPRGGGSPRRGLRGSLDLPQGSVEEPQRVDLAGWVFHQHAEILLVVVTADGRLVATAPLDIARPDVAAAHPDAAELSGWAVVADLGRVRDPVLLEAHALVRLAAGEDGRPRTVMVPFAERELPVVGGGIVRGRIDVPEEVAPGVVRVTGSADIDPALARVDVLVDGAPAVTARHSLPSTGSGPDPEGSLRGFSAHVVVPAGVAEVTVRATVTSTQGTRADLPARTVRVRDETSDTGNPHRRRVQDRRLQEHLAALRRAVPPGRRVLVAAHDLHVGGAQAYLDDLVRGLHAAGIELCVVSGSAGPLLDRIEADYAAPVLVVGPPPQDPELLASRIRLIAGFAVEHGVAACVANTLVAFPAVLAAERLGIPSAWAIHESFAPAVFWHEYLGHGAHPDILAATHEALASCTEVLFEAESTRAMYADLVPAPAASLVPYGVDTDAMDRSLEATSREIARTDLGISPIRRVLVCVGTVEPRKGQLALARAFARIDPGLRAETDLYLVGAGDTAYARALRDHVETARLSSVHVVDVDPDISRWYVAADVLVSASDVESMPRTMIEAMLVGRPVAAADAFGVGELVEDGVSGWLCPPRDLAALTDVLTRAVTADESELTAMGKAARARVRARHDSAGYVTHVTDRVRGWLDDPPGTGAEG